MNLRDFRKAGHLPTLFSAFLYFDISFMVWVLCGALANNIAEEIHMTDAQRGLMLALPLLGGSALRLLLGWSTDRYGARRTGAVGLAATLVPLLLGWLWVVEYWQLLVVGAMLGIAGASFAAALPLASRWYPPQHQGLAMGIAGAGNSGTALATLFGPMLAATLTWHGVFGLALLPIAATLAIFLRLAKDSPNQPPPLTARQYASVLRQAECWWFNLFYSVTFGGFVGLSMFLPTFFFKQYPGDMTKVGAGQFATACVIAGSFLRPVGGYLADRLGGIRLLLMLYGGAGLALAGMAFLPPLAAATVFMFVAMGMLGMGNGAVFQLVPQRFGKEIGVITGIVGAAGGVGGFLLNIFFGYLKEWTGSYSTGFALFAAAAGGSLTALGFVSRQWQGSFVGKSGVATEVSVPAIREAAWNADASTVALARP
jgi:NNP family nitrate/nitrite transporter-like MFS transporter